MDNNFKNTWCVNDTRLYSHYEELFSNEQAILRYAGIDKFDLNNGIGIGVTLFMQYCTHHCKGCQNPSTWSKDGGKQFDVTVLNELFSALANNNITRLTLSGGDPLDSLKLSTYIATEFKYLYPQKSLWIYTGYKYEEICNQPEYQEILRLCDVLVDGEFQIENKDLSLQFRGSKNQRIIDIKKTIESGIIVLWNMKYKGETKK